MKKEEGKRKKNNTTQFYKIWVFMEGNERRERSGSGRSEEWTRTTITIITTNENWTRWGEKRNDRKKKIVRSDAYNTFLLELRCQNFYLMCWKAIQMSGIIIPFVNRKGCLTNICWNRIRATNVNIYLQWYWDGDVIYTNT